MSERIVIFSDLDGTLLDHDTYSHEAANEAIEIVRENDIPLVLASSKTRAEIENHRIGLGNSDPFISENGGAVFIPTGYFSVVFDYSRESKPYRVIELGTRHKELTDALEKVTFQTGAVIRSFSKMSIEEAQDCTGLDEENAVLARMREYDEPFIIANGAGVKKDVESAIIELGYRFTEGGRFCHILGGSDKGRAVSILIKLFEAQFGVVKTIGLGDGLNDLPMLKEVDFPVLVARKDGSWDDRIDIPNLKRAEGAGPVGWASAVKEILQDLSAI